MRANNWQSLLAAFVASREGAPFAWGTNDCCTFAADAVKAMCDYDPAKGLRTYHGPKGAQTVLRRGGGIAELATERLGPGITPALASVGDIGLVRPDSVELGPALVVCGGSMWIGPGPDGLLRVPSVEVVRAWRAC